MDGNETANNSEAESNYKDVEAINFEQLCERIADELGNQLGGKFSVRLQSFSAKSLELAFNATDNTSIERSVARDRRRGEGFYDKDNPFTRLRDSYSS